MNYDLNDNKNLISFFNSIFQNEELADYAPDIMKFFIITRNFGLINFQENINKLINNSDFYELIIDTIKDGFKNNNIEYNSQTMIAYIIYNYHQKGFYFHSFPFAYINNIRENGLLANNRNNDDNLYYNIMEKYQFSNYFTNSNNRVCVTEKMSLSTTHAYSLFTPEWLEIFLSLGSNNVHEAFKEGNLEELLRISNKSLINIKKEMIKNPQYSENDYLFLEKYISKIINNRFRDGNNKIGIALIEKQQSVDYFGNFIKLDMLKDIEKVINSQGLDEKKSIDFIINDLTKGEKTTNQNIPTSLINTISYQIRNNDIYYGKTI